MTVSDRLLTELDTLIEEGTRIAESFRHRSLLTWLWESSRGSDVPEWTIRAFITRAAALIEHIAGRDSQFYRQFIVAPDRTLSLEPEIVAAAVGALRALRHAIDAGLLLQIEARLRIAVYDDLLAQAEALEAAEYVIGAMVVSGAVLEQHLRKLCLARQLSHQGAGSLSKYNDLLRSNVYDQATWRRVQVIADLRNKAAHVQQVQPADVKESVAYVRRFMSDYPA
jgi:hypothetical protein